MSKYEEQRRKEIAQKFGMDSLKVGQGNPRGTIQLSESPVTPSKFAISREKQLKEKFGLHDGLQLVGLEKKPDQRSLADAIHEKNLESTRGMKLAVAKTTDKNGAAMNVWYEFRR